MRWIEILTRARGISRHLNNGVAQLAKILSQRPSFRILSVCFLSLLPASCFYFGMHCSTYFNDNNKPRLPPAGLALDELAAPYRSRPRGLPCAR
ncbi:hypothetical protein V1281_000014 [Nitrobacteraceae bacterium AZCC 2161]